MTEGAARLSAFVGGGFVDAGVLPTGFRVASVATVLRLDPLAWGEARLGTGLCRYFAASS